MKEDSKIEGAIDGNGNNMGGVPDTPLVWHETSAVLQVFGLALATGLWFMIQRTYHEGYLAALEVPSSIGVETQPGLASLLWWLVLTFCGITGALKMLSLLAQPLAWLRHNGLSSILWDTILIGLIGLGFFLLTFDQTGFAAIPWGWKLLTGVLWLWCFFAILKWWIEPHYSNRGQGLKCMERFKKFADEKRMAAKEQQKKIDEIDRIQEKKYPTFDLAVVLGRVGDGKLVWVLIIVVLFPSLSYGVGWWRTTQQETWATVQHSDLPTSEVEHWVVLGKSDKGLIVTAVNKQNKLTGLYRTISLNASTITEKTIGRLENSEPNPEPAKTEPK